MSSELQKQETVAARLKRTFEGNPDIRVSYIKDEKIKDRVMHHDVIHCLLRDDATIGTLTYPDEVQAAVVQMVLLRSTRLSYKSYSEESSEAVSQRSIPSVFEVLAKMRVFPKAAVRGLKKIAPLEEGMSYPQPSADEIKKHYKIATVFDEKFYQQFGKHFCDVPPAEMMQMSFTSMAEVFQDARIQAEKLGRGVIAKD